MASNTVATADQRRMDYQQSSTVDGLLKNVYIPALNNVVFHSTPLMEMFGDFGGTIDFAANKIIKAFKTQQAGGFGGISEGGDWVKGCNQKGFQGFEKLKYLNAYVSLTGPAARTVRSGEGGYVDAISSAMDDTLKNARMQMERIIGGAGDGKLASFTNASVTETTVGQYLKNVNGAGSTTYAIADHALTAAATGGAYTPVQWLQDGMRVELVSATNWDSNLADAHSEGPFIVDKVDHSAGTFSLISTGSITLSGAGVYYLVLENAYGENEAAATSEYEGIATSKCLEPNGLANLVSDTGSIWNMDRATYPRALKSTVVAAGGAELDEELLMGWILDLVNIKQNVPNVLVTDPKSRLKYFSNRKEDRRFDMPVIDTPFGFRSTGVVIDQYQLALQSLTSLVPGTLYMLNTGDFKFAKATNGFEWVTNENGSVFRQKEGSDNLYASAINYMNFVCENPMGQFKATGLSY